MLPSRPCPSQNRKPRSQLLAGSRPLKALRKLHMHHRPSHTVQCAASASKAPELTPQEQQLLQYVLNYQYTVELPEGQLVISPLREKWLQRTGDLLADTFVDAKGIQPYRRYVRRNIGKYLDQHIHMPPAAVLVTAVLRTRVEGSAGTDLGLHDFQQTGPNNAAQASSSSSSSSSGSIDSDADTSEAFDAVAVGAALEEPQSADHPLTRLLLSCFGWLVKPNNPDSQAAIDTSISSSNSTMSSQGRPLIEQSGTADADPVTQFSTSSSSSGAADAYAAITGNDPPNSSNSSSSGKADGRNVAELVGSALLRLSDSVTLPQLRLQHKPSQTHVVETLVGVAEVSFRERTRSQALTLNPPQKCGYLCNMAVAQQWRRRGVASQLMTAVEDMCLLAGEADLYLHLRFKDAATAGSLYRKHGFTQASKDCWLLLLVGQEPRFLMLKQLAAARTLVGRVSLPEFQQGVTAAELQQQQKRQQEVTGATNSMGAAAQPSATPAASPAT